MQPVHPTRQRLRRAVRLLVALVFATLLAVGGALAPMRAAAASGDQIDSFDIRYVMAASGVLHAQETITYRFGPSSGRHGIDRYLVTREKYDQDHDALYGVNNVQVAYGNGASVPFTSSTSKAQNGRQEKLRLRIGDPNAVLSAPTATYVLSYDVTGAMRSFAGYDEFFWDATGFDSAATIKSVKISATVPGGAERVSCFYGPPGSKTTCPATNSGGVARFSQTNVPPGQGVSVGAEIKSGLVADDKPHLAPDGSRMTSGSKLALAGAGVGALALFAGVPLLGLLWWRRNGRDQRYAGLPPGTVPLPGQPAEVVLNDPDLPIPVAFAPPKIPVAEAGLLVDGQVDTRETAATIIDLAVRGALRVNSSSEDDFSVTLLDQSRTSAPHERVLIGRLFNGQPAGTVIDLSAPGSLEPAHQAMREAVIRQVQARGWFRKLSSPGKTSGFGAALLIAAVFILFHANPLLLLVLVPVLPIVITIAVIRSKLKRGQRTPDGRAVCDQVEGFKTYLATAEAEQLRFEEGEDIFSRYLPWAIAFELADRWAKICGELVKMGRLPADAPYWYYGSYNMYAFNTGFLTSSLTTAAAPAPSSSSSSGTGFGGGSSFGGGGFSGGGGGGGGVGSW